MSRPWSHPVVLNKGPLDWESSALTTRPLLYNIYEEVKHEISGTAIGTKFALTYASTFMDEIETNFLDAQKFKLLVWFRYIDDVFFIWAHAKGKLKEFLKKISITTTQTLNLPMSSIKKAFSFWTLR